VIGSGAVIATLQGRVSEPQALADARPRLCADDQDASDSYVLPQVVGANFFVFSSGAIPSVDKAFTTKPNTNAFEYGFPC
jgi:hypothetical protein